MSAKPTVDLADLPAPKRAGGLGDAPKPPPPRSALDDAELPAPKGAKPTAAPSALDLDDLMPPSKSSEAGLADLPTPKPRGSALGDAPASRPAPSALADLPAPKAKPSALADLPAPKAKPSALADLPAPKSKPGLTDLPAPKGKPGALDLDDLPAPKSMGGRPLAASMPSLDDDLDLPAPAAHGGGYGNLPMPKPGANNDLPMPKPGANNDLPAPKGFFDDLPQPAKKGSNIDLPAPKGFFDDLPQPALSGSKPELPAPKSFFDDLPQPTKSPAPGAPASGGGFFDDLPQPSKSAKGGGLFDDLAPAGGKQGGPDAISFGNDIELSPGLGGDRPLELDGGGGPELDLGLPMGDSTDFTELDLSEPSAKSGKQLAAEAAAMPTEPGSPIKIKTPKAGGKQTPIAISVPKKDAGPVDLKLDLADDPHDGKAAAAATAGGKTAKRKGKSAEETAEDKAAKRKRSRIVLASLLGLSLLGAGGFYFYKKHTAEQARQDTISEQLAIAKKALGDANANHWTRAFAAAEEVLAIEPNHVPALGVAAEAAIAGALDNGINYDARIKTGRNRAQQGIGVGKTSTELERAKAVMAIAAGQADRSVPMLQQLIAADPKSGWLQLYMGWALLAKGDAPAAQTAFEQAVALDAATKLPALYGHGQAKLLKADIEGARVDFATVLEMPDGKKHIGAQVGLAATLPPQQSAQREADLMAILNLPEAELAKADPRAVGRAWVLAGDVARTSGRYDIARERYRKAIAITALDVSALNGLAAVELREGKIQIARDLLQKALAANPNDAESQLLDASADIAEGKLPEADTKLAKLFERQPPLPPLQLARLHVAKGRLLETQGKDEEAIAEYSKGAKLAGDLDLTPTMAAVTKLTALAKKAPDEASAMGYRDRAAELLAALAEKAKEDGEVAMTLGVAYLQAGDATKAEVVLRRAVAMREKDPESRLQLARALVALNRTDEAVASLKEALAIDPKRGDVSLELARTYQNAGRHTEAMAAYDKLLTEENVPVIVRMLAGRYFASRGEFAKAAAQAEPILKVEPQNAGGLYLKGEGLILTKNWDDARKALTRASDLDITDAQALDALGRAFEGSHTDTDELKYIEGARHAYHRATKADPKMFHPYLGLGRSYVRKGDWNEALQALTVASGLDKTNSEVMYNMGLAYYGLRTTPGPYKKTAAQWFESALKNKPEMSLEDRAEANYKLGDLYFEQNKPGDAARAFDAATRTGEEVEKQTGRAPEWLTETFYRLGQVYEGQNDKANQKRAWTRFVDRKPKPSDRVKAAEYWLNTTGKNF